jgi:hypothetical protein
MDGMDQVSGVEVNPKRKAFTHEFDNEHYSVNVSPAHQSRMFFEFVGPEQVSPHYESFLASRKWAIGFWASCLSLSYIGASLDFHWVARSMIIPFVFWTSTFYWIFEGRKHIVKPLFSRWYRSLAYHDIRNFQSYYQDNARLEIKKNINNAKEQMDYFLLHKRFNAIKAESINRFLAHEQVNLKAHINERSQNILRAAKAAEVTNSRAVVNTVVANAIERVNATLESDSARIQDEIFESALLGIAKGKMTYEKDPILPIAQQTIREEVAKITSLSEAEQLNLVALTDLQIQNLRNADDSAKKEFLENVPKIDQLTQASEYYQKIAATWGK